MSITYDITEVNEVRFERTKHGQYTFYVNGRFFGNYDNLNEGLRDVEDLKRELEELMPA